MKGVITILSFSCCELCNDMTGYGSLMKPIVAYFSTLDNYMFRFEPGVSDQIMYPGKSHLKVLSIYVLAC